MKLRIFAALFIVLISATSCLKTDDQASGTGDAIIIVKKVGQSTVYGVSLYAYTFSEFKSVSVSASKDGVTVSYDLAANQGYKTNFYYETPSAGFSPEIPLVTDYVFTAQFENGSTQTFSDALTDKVLAVPNITKLEYDTVKNNLSVAWDEVTNADSYAINIMDGNTVIFSTVELAKTNKSYSVSSASSGWSLTNPPVNGKTYTVRVFAFLYESSANAYNVQCTSVGEGNIVWGGSANN